MTEQLIAPAASTETLNLPQELAAFAIEELEQRVETYWYYYCSYAWYFDYWTWSYVYGYYCQWVWL